MPDEALFDLADVNLAAAAPHDRDDGPTELREGDDAAASCRYCRTATTARGIGNRGHGAGSETCARMLDWQARGVIS